MKTLLVIALLLAPAQALASCEALLSVHSRELAFNYVEATPLDGELWTPDYRREYHRSLAHALAVAQRALEYARMHARRSNVAGASGQAAKAVMEEAHAIMCEQGRWVCNEKQLIDRAGLSAVQAVFGDVPVERATLLRWVDRVADQLGVLEQETPPWSDSARRA